MPNFQPWIPEPDFLDTFYWQMPFIQPPHTIYHTYPRSYLCLLLFNHRMFSVALLSFHSHGVILFSLLLVVLMMFSRCLIFFHSQDVIHCSRAVFIFTMFCIALLSFLISICYHVPSFFSFHSHDVLRLSLFIFILTIFCRFLFFFSFSRCSPAVCFSFHPHSVLHCSFAFSLSRCYHVPSSSFQSHDILTCSWDWTGVDARGSLFEWKGEGSTAEIRMNWKEKIAQEYIVWMERRR